MQPDKIFASKLLGTSYSPVSLVSGATVFTCEVELPVSHFYMHYDDDDDDDDLSIWTISKHNSAHWLSIFIMYFLSIVNCYRTVLEASSVNILN